MIHRRNEKGINAICSQFCPAVPRGFCQLLRGGAWRGSLFLYGAGGASIPGFKDGCMGPHDRDHDDDDDCDFQVQRHGPVHAAKRLRSARGWLLQGKILMGGSSVGTYEQCSLYIPHICHGRVKIF